MMREIYEDPHPFIVVQKAAQVGASEYGINSALWAADTGQGDRGNVLYVMPTSGMMRDFTQTRFERAIAESPYLKRRAGKQDARRTLERSGLMRLGDGYIYRHGSDARSLASVDADLVVLDEYDLMEPDVLPRALQRLGSSSFGRIRVVSTPRYPEAGINGLFLKSDRRHYELPCPECGRGQILGWGENVDTELRMIVCKHCHAAMDPWLEGRWLVGTPGNTEIRGYYLSQLYSPYANVDRMVLLAEGQSPAEQQEFQNQVLGEVFTPRGSGITAGDLDLCRDRYRLTDYGGQRCYMGVDVGTHLHVVIRDAEDSRLWYASAHEGFGDLDALMTNFNVVRCVIDAQPEMRKAKEFAVRHPGEAWPAYYVSEGDLLRVVRGERPEPDTARLNRTELLDLLTQRVSDRVLRLPSDARGLGGLVRDGIGDFYRHWTAATSTLEETPDGNWRRRWLRSGRPDHFFHAEAYALAASELEPPGGRILGVFSFDRDGVSRHWIAPS